MAGSKFFVSILLQLRYFVEGWVTFFHYWLAWTTHRNPGPTWPIRRQNVLLAVTSSMHLHNFMASNRPLGCIDTAILEYTVEMRAIFGSWKILIGYIDIYLPI